MIKFLIIQRTKAEKLKKILFAYFFRKTHWSVQQKVFGCFHLHIGNLFEILEIGCEIHIE